VRQAVIQPADRREILIGDEMDGCVAIVRRVNIRLMGGDLALKIHRVRHSSSRSTVINSLLPSCRLWLMREERLKQPDFCLRRINNRSCCISASSTSTATAGPGHGRLWQYRLRPQSPGTQKVHGTRTQVPAPHHHHGPCHLRGRRRQPIRQSIIPTGPSSSLPPVWSSPPPLRHEGPNTSPLSASLCPPSPPTTARPTPASYAASRGRTKGRQQQGRPGSTFLAFLLPPASAAQTPISTAASITLLCRSQVHLSQNLPAPPPDTLPVWRPPSARHLCLRAVCSRVTGAKCLACRHASTLGDRGR
jgi:hypothetical protein